MITRTDIHYITTFICYCVILSWYWNSKLRKRSGCCTSGHSSNTFSGTEPRTNTNFNSSTTASSTFGNIQSLNRFTSSSKSAGMIILALALIFGILYNFICITIKYHYSYVQIPNKMLFLARPYDTWKVDCRWLLESAGFLSEVCLYLGVYLGLVVVWNANCLVVPAHFPNVQSLTNSVLVRVKWAFCYFIASMLIFVFSFPFKPSSWTKYLIGSILTLPWPIWCFLLASKIKTILLALEDGEDSISITEGVANNSLFVLERIPKFRITEQMAALNMLSCFLAVAWLGWFSSGVLVGELMNVFFLDIFSAFDYFGHFVVFLRIIDLTFPDSAFNLHNSHNCK